jgi:hypothetical protein
VINPINANLSKGQTITPDMKSTIEVITGS